MFGKVRYLLILLAYNLFLINTRLFGKHIKVVYFRSF